VCSKSLSPAIMDFSNILAFSIILNQTLVTVFYIWIMYGWYSDNLKWGEVPDWPKKRIFIFLFFVFLSSFTIHTLCFCNLRQWRQTAFKNCSGFFLSAFGILGPISSSTYFLFERQLPILDHSNAKYLHALLHFVATILGTYLSLFSQNLVKSLSLEPGFYRVR